MEGNAKKAGTGQADGVKNFGAAVLADFPASAGMLVSLVPL